MLTLERAYLPDRSVTLGRLTLPDGWSCYTLELPWLSNGVGKSCIPEGVYDMAMRESPIVKRTSGGSHPRGWEVTDVPGRTYIMFHPGNFASDTEGCILPGNAFQWSGREGFMVANSRATFGPLMDRLAKQRAWRLHVTNTQGGQL